ncbi:hypothetical protein BH581_16755 [Vibrio splendidus]|uniref:ABC-three component system middle component 7 n=1 Tax=Vibrio splendidus TaxID=29497 RepID=UPI0009787966|nr:hypothetical protein BH581_16755 [Vibrio splendidus]
MIIPNKSVPFKKTVIHKMLVILNLDFEEIAISDLYSKTKSKFSSMDEFVYSIDLLYVLDKIVIDDFGLVKKC